MEGTLRRRIREGGFVATAAALSLGLVLSSAALATRPPDAGPPAASLGARLLMTGSRTAAPAAGAPRAADAASVPLLLVGDPDRAALQRLGVRLRTRAGTVWTASAPPSVVPDLAGVSGLRSAERATRLAPLLDVAAAETGAAGLRTRTGATWSGITGRGVLVGIVDTGVDATHEDFRNLDGSTRIVGYWDQTVNAAPPPDGFDYGSYWARPEIDAGAVLPGDAAGHGTHVASVAAGNGNAASATSRFAGIAPEADLAVVATAGYEDAVIDAVAFLFALAEQRGQPCVINLSLGTHLGSHDGEGPLETALDALVGPGRLLVVAAGNDGGRGVHAELEIPPGGADSALVNVTVTPGGDGFSFFDIEGWHAAGENLGVTVVTPSGARFGPYRAGDLEPDRLTGEGTLFAYHAVETGHDGRTRLFLEISNTTPGEGGGEAVPPASGGWRVVARNTGSEPAEIDLWVASTFPANAVQATWAPEDRDPDEEIAVPGTARRVITVGSYNTRRCWEGDGGERCSTVPEPESDPGAVSWFSSAGPTRDGRQKPEVIAPGFVITAARSHQIDPASAADLGLPGTSHADGEHMVRAGTSLSAPHVAGTLALALELRPGLTPESARERLVSTARPDPRTGDAWSPRGGFGKLDARAFVDLVPVREAGFVLTTTSAGRPEIAWTARAGSGLAGFLILRRVPGADWRVVARREGVGSHRWIDNDANGPATYRLDAVDRDGRHRSWGEQAWAPPRQAGLLHVSPNPFSGSAHLALPGAAPGSEVSVRVWDASGRRVRAWTGDLETLSWDGRDERGRPAPGGVYWVEAVVRDERRVARLVRLP